MTIKCTLYQLKRNQYIQRITMQSPVFTSTTIMSLTLLSTSTCTGELEITDVNKECLRQGKLDVKLMGRGYAWLDTGTHDSMLEAANFIATIERRQNLKVAALEEIAYRMGYIDRDKLVELAQPHKKNDYGQYLLRLAK